MEAPLIPYKYFIFKHKTSCAMFKLRAFWRPANLTNKAQKELLAQLDKSHNV